MFKRAAELAVVCDARSFANQVDLIAALVRRVTVAQDKVTIEVGRKALAARLLNEEAAAKVEARSSRTFSIEVPVRFRRRGVEAKLIIADQKHTGSEPDANLVKALARAHEWFGQIVRGEADGIGAIARAERLDRAYVTRIICLAFLVPEIAKMIVEGRHPTELTAKRLIRSTASIPFSWMDQLRLLST